MNDKYINILIKQMERAIKKNEVAVSAIVVKNNKIISKAYNKRMKNNDVTAHAEILAIRKASKKLKDWRLNGCDMYVTLKPCTMCESVIKESRIDNCYYLSNRLESKRDYRKTKISYLQTNREEKLIEIIRKSFKNIRK